MWECPLCGERSDDQPDTKRAPLEAALPASSLDASYVLLGPRSSPFDVAAAPGEGEGEDTQHTGVAAVLGRASRLRRCSAATTMECGSCASCIQAVAQGMGQELHDLNRERLAYAAAIERCRSQSAALERNYDSANPSAAARARQLQALDDALALSTAEIANLQDALQVTQQRRCALRDDEHDVMRELLVLQRDELRAREESARCVAAYSALVDEAQFEPELPALDDDAVATDLSSLEAIEAAIERVAREVQPT